MGPRCSSSGCPARAVVGGCVTMKNRVQQSSPQEPTQHVTHVYRCQLTGPRQPLNPEPWKAFFVSIFSTSATVALEIHIAQDKVEFVLASDMESIELLKRGVNGILTDVAVTPSQGSLSPEKEPLIAVLHRTGAPIWAPLRDIDDFNGTDPMSALLEAVQPLSPNDRVLIRFLARPTDNENYKKAYKEITRAIFSGTIWDLIALLGDNLPRGPKFEARLQRRLEERLARPLFEVIGQVALFGSDKTRLRSLAGSLAAVLWGQFNSGFGGIQLSLLTPEETNAPPTLIITGDELAALWHLPSELVTTPGVTFLKHPSTVLPLSILKQPGLALGVHSQRGESPFVYLSRQDLDAGHLICIGRTGVGKSTLMHQLLSLLTAEPDRPGVWVVDPHNDLEAGLALRGIPRDRWDDVVMIDLSDTDFPIGIPFFAPPRGVSREAMIQTTFSLLRSIFRDHWSETRMADTVFALTATLCSLPDATLLDAPRLFTDQAYRRRAIGHVADPVALEFWSDFDALSKGAQRELVRPVLYRLRAFYRSGAVRNIVCRNDGLDFTDLLGKIVLIGLSGPEVLAESDLLGELIIARLHLAALSRLALPENLRPRTYLACDESHRFKGASLPTLWSEGRKLGVTLLMSTQFIAGWSEALADAVMGNTGTIVAFRCGPQDSRRLANTIRPFTSEQLEDLNRFQAIVKLQSAGITIPAFDITTLPPVGSPDPTALEYIRSRSRQLYARPRKEVEAELSNPPKLPNDTTWDWSVLDDDP